MIVAVAILGAVNLVLASLLVYQIHVAKTERRAALAQMAVTTADAMKMIMAKNIAEKVQADALQQQYDVQIENLKDAYATHMQKEKEPRLAKTEDGRVIDLDDPVWEG